MVSLCVFCATSLVEPGPPLQRIASAPAILRVIYDAFQLAKTIVVQLLDAHQQEPAVEEAITLDVTRQDPSVDTVPETTVLVCVKENQMEVVP